MAGPDLVVMGAGVFGLSLAWAAARRGARVRVVERDRIGAGASGGVVGALMPHAPGAPWTEAKAFQLESLVMAADWWAAVGTAAGLGTGYARTGRLVPLADAAAAAAAGDRQAEALRRWGAAVTWAVVPAPAGWGPASPSGLVLHETLSARIAPRAALAALAAAVRSRGGEIAAGDAPDRDGVPVVWATGPAGLAALSADLGAEAGRGIKGQAALLAFDAGPGAPQIYAEGLHIVPHGDGTVAVGSTTEADFADPAAPDALLEEVIARARAACPALADAPVTERWAALRPRARTRNPLLGPWPGRPGWFVMNGGFKTGFGIAPLAAEAMADLVLEGRAGRIPPGFLPLGRAAGDRANLSPVAP